MSVEVFCMPNKQIISLIRSLTTERLFLFILFITISLTIQGYNPDGYLHLTTGRLIMDTGALPHVDLFSFSRFGEPWVMHEWLYQVLFYNIHEIFGEIGLQVLGGGILTTVIYLTKKNCTLAGANNVTSWFATITLFLAWMLFLGTRPHDVTYLFFNLSLYFILLHRKNGTVKQLYVIPLLMVPWVNIHGGFIVGIVLLGYITLLSFIENYTNTKQWQIPWHLFNSFVLTILASLFNPYGIEQLFFPFELMNQWAMEYVPEWMPPDFTAWNYIIYAVAVLSFVISSLFIPVRQRLFQLIFTSPFVIASLYSVRHVPIASFVVAPYFAANIYNISTKLITSAIPYESNTNNTANYTSRRRQKHDLGIVENIFNWIVLCLFLTLLYFTYPLVHEKKLASFKKMYPVGATRYLIENNIHGRMFTSMQYSDYILFHRYPEQKIFYDVRIETYGQALSSDFIKMSYVYTGWEELFTRYKIDFIVIDKENTAYTTYAKNHDFRIIYEDKYSTIFSISSQK
jgi:hypothetical protein